MKPLTTSLQVASSLLFFLMVLTPTAFAQGLPLNFTSAQRVVFGVQDPLCSEALRFKGNPYSVSIDGFKISVRVGEIDASGVVVPLCPPGNPLQIDLGVLPPGIYTYQVFERSSSNAVRPTSEGTIRITDHRATKAAPYVVRDYSGTWWDAADPGWGLFIWQDANSSKDSLLIAWFTYDPSGQPVWYTFQPEWATSTATKEGTLFRSTRPLGVGTPPPGDTTRVAVGTASIDFTSLRNEAFVATFKYQLGSSPAVTKRIVPFKP
jgi:hypothetical protein